MAIAHGTTVEVCYVTHDIERAVKHWAEILKAGPFYILNNDAGFGQRTYRGAPAKDSFRAAIGFLGNTMIEFIQPTDDEPSVFQEVLKTQGEMAVHHVYPDIRPLNAAEYDAMHSRYTDLGYVAALEMVLPGLGRCTLFDAREELGVFVELLEISAQVYASLENMHTAHVNWDGSRPLRDFMESMPD